MEHKKSEQNTPSEDTARYEESIRLAREMISSGRTPKKKPKIKGLFHLVVFVVSWFGGCLMVTSILEHFLVPFATTIGSIGWSCCFGLSVMFYHKEITSLQEAAEREINFLDEQVTVYDEAVTNAISDQSILPLYRARAKVISLYDRLEK